MAKSSHNTYRIRYYDQQTQQWLYKDVEYGTNPTTGEKLDTGNGKRTSSGKQLSSMNRIVDEPDDDYKSSPSTSTSSSTATPTPLKPKRSIYDSSVKSDTGKKIGKYYQLGSNIANLVQNKYTEAGKKQENANFWQGLVSTVSTALSWIPVVGQIAVGAGGMVNNWIQYGSTKKQNKLVGEAQTLEQMATNLSNYVNSLSNRDEIIEDSVYGMYGALDEMSATYGSEFVDQIFNVYMAASGVTPESYSLLNGNFNVFSDDMVVGNVSGDNGMFDQLTNGDYNYFNNVYAQITAEDISKVHDRLVQSLYGANTAFSEQLRGYEVELRNLLEGALATEKSTVANATSELAQLQAGYRSENIGYAENIGSAEAGSAVSGMRGATAYNNVALQELSRDIGLIRRTAELTAFVGNFNYQIENMHKQLSMSAYNLRQNQIIAQRRAEESTIVGFNSIGRSLQSSERKSNYYIGEAQNYERQVNEGYEKLSADDADAVFASF